MRATAGFDDATSRLTSAAAPSRKTILLVDDADTARVLCRRVLEMGGYRVLQAASAEEALALLSTERVHLILIDYMMPGMDGPTFVRSFRAREQGARASIVFLSASPTSEHVAESFAAGADDFLAKPIRPRILLSQVELALARASAPVTPVPTADARASRVGREGTSASGAPGAVAALR